jgi:hypothetical protein
LQSTPRTLFPWAVLHTCSWAKSCSTLQITHHNIPEQPPSFAGFPRGTDAAPPGDPCHRAGDLPGHPHDGPVSSNAGPRRGTLPVRPAGELHRRRRTGGPTAWQNSCPCRPTDAGRRPTDAPISGHGGASRPNHGTPGRFSAAGCRGAATHNATAADAATRTRATTPRSKGSNGCPGDHCAVLSHGAVGRRVPVPQRVLHRQVLALSQRKRGHGDAVKAHLVGCVDCLRARDSDMQCSSPSVGRPGRWDPPRPPSPRPLPASCQARTFGAV